VQLGAVTARHVRDHAARQRRREGRREVIKGCEEGVNGMKVAAGASLLSLLSWRTALQGSAN